MVAMIALRAKTVWMLFALAGCGGRAHASRVGVAFATDRSAHASSKDNLAPVDQSTLNESPEFTGDTAYKSLCTFYQDRVRSKQYNKAGCVSKCSTLTIDCNSGDDDGIIDVTYYRSKNWLSSMTTKYGVYKKHPGVKGRHMLFKYYDGRMQSGIYTGGVPKMEGCLPWMRNADSWCEGPKWTKSEDQNILISPADTARWQMTYMWIQWDDAKGEFVLEEDQVSGSKQPDEVMVRGMQLDGLGDGVGTMGPNVPGWYTVGVRGWTKACLDNDKPKGTDLPVLEDKECDIDIWKVTPQNGDIVKTSWHTHHSATLDKKRFS